MNAIAKRRGLGPSPLPVSALHSSRPVTTAPAALARWATDLDERFGFGDDNAPAGPQAAALQDLASRTSEQTFDLALEVAPTNAEDCIAQLVVLVNRFRLAAMGDGDAKASTLVDDLTTKLERTTLALARIQGADPMPLGGAIFFYPAAVAAAGFPSPYSKESAR